MDLVDQVGKLADIVDGAGILLIEKRDPIGVVEGQGDIEDRESLIVFGVPKFDHVEVARLRILVD